MRLRLWGVIRLSQFWRSFSTSGLVKMFATISQRSTHGHPYCKRKRSTILETLHLKLLKRVLTRRHRVPQRKSNMGAVSTKAVETGLLRRVIEEDSD